MGPAPRGFIWLVAIFLAALLKNSDAREVKAFVGSTVALPCRVDLPNCGELHSVKWYRDTSRIYVFSQDGGFKKAEGDAVERMEVEYEPTSTDALLKISSVRIEDEAYYKCEITYLEVRENCDIVQVIKLNTLVIPEVVRIHNKGESITNETVLEAADEGTEIEVVCEARRGRPTPNVRWFNGTEEMKASYSVEEESDGVGTGIAKLQTSLSRGDLRTRFECRVESDALDTPIVSTIYPNVSVRPTKVELKGVEGHVVQGTNVMLICDAYNARPPAQIKWLNGSQIINETGVNTFVEPARDGTYNTKSELVFRSSRWENGQAFYCLADNPVMLNQKEYALRSVMHLEVYYPPVVSVSPVNVTTNESSQVLLMCTYFANPQKLENVIWAKDGKNLTLDKEKYEGGTIEYPPLRILNVTRDDMGFYACICGNSVGSQESDTSVFLNVIYAPSVAVVMKPSTPVKSMECTNVTLECRIESGNPTEFEKVRWFLDGEVFHENDCNQNLYETSTTCNTTRKCKIDPSLILLERVQESFAGNYSCQAKNLAGWGDVSEDNELVVYYPPNGVRLTYGPSIVIKKASVTLRCLVDDTGRPDNITYIWYRGSHEVREIRNKSWVINPVTLETRSNFSCMALNEGGASKRATVFVEVEAPPAFIQNLPPYQGILSSSKNVSLTCRVECYPICSIVWFKDGHPLDVTQNPMYYVKTAVYPPDVQKNDFESIESTLFFNISAWPGEQLDRAAPNSNYTCQSFKNLHGPGVNSTVEIAVDYPPENLTTSSRLVHVTEFKKPELVKCSGKGHPAISYTWRKEGSTEALSKKSLLQLEALSREASGTYICEASNRHGTASISVYFNVLFPPECTIANSEVNGRQTLICSAKANPDELQFTWFTRELNETNDATESYKEGQKSFLILDSSVNYDRTFVCYANNSVGRSSACEIRVPGNVPWWQKLERETMIIIIASIVAIVICVIIVCLIIIILCRRKRASNKSPNSSSTENKTNLGVAPPDGGLGNPNGMSNPNPEDRGFYENLPFHGMQNPPNKTNGTTARASDTYIY